MSGATESSSLPIATLWAVVLLELLSPVPAILTFGAIWVLAVRPPWFREMVEQLYADREQPD